MINILKKRISSDLIMRVCVLLLSCIIGYYIYTYIRDSNWIVEHHTPITSVNNVTIIINNKTKSDMRYFLIGNINNLTYEGKQIINNNNILDDNFKCVSSSDVSNLDCQRGKNGAGNPVNCVITFTIAKDNLIQFIVDEVYSGVIWGINQSNPNMTEISRGRTPGMSSIEFSIVHEKLTYNVSGVDGINYGITTTVDGKQEVHIIPKPTSQILKNYHYNVLGYDCILSDKWIPPIKFKNIYNNHPFRNTMDLVGLTYNKMSIEDVLHCPAKLADTYCGQKTCRQLYHEMKQITDSYCEWVHTNKYNFYCWAMDEKVCSDNGDKLCGWDKCPHSNDYSCIGSETCDTFFGKDQPLVSGSGYQASWLSCGCSEQALGVRPSLIGIKKCGTSKKVSACTDDTSRKVLFNHDVKSGLKLYITWNDINYSTDTIETTISSKNLDFSASPPQTKKHLKSLQNKHPIIRCNPNLIPKQLCPMGEQCPSTGICKSPPPFVYVDTPDVKKTISIADSSKTIINSKDQENKSPELPEPFIIAETLRHNKINPGKKLITSYNINSKKYTLKKIDPPEEEELDAIINIFKSVKELHSTIQDINDISSLKNKPTNTERHNNIINSIKNFIKDTIEYHKNPQRFEYRREIHQTGNYEKSIYQDPNSNYFNLLNINKRKIPKTTDKLLDWGKIFQNKQRNENENRKRELEILREMENKGELDDDDDDDDNGNTIAQVDKDNITNMNNNKLNTNCWYNSMFEDKVILNNYNR